MKIIDLAVGSLDWHAYRADRIGASDSAAILGISPFKTALGLYEEKVLGKTQPDNSAMKRGREREQEALDWAMKELDCYLKPQIVESDLGWKFATLDGFGRKNSFDVAIEIKWANKEVHALAKQNTVIDYYYSQVQSQIFCCDIDSMYFLSCYQVGKHDVDYVIFKVERDDRYIAKMLRAEKAFYFDHLIPQIPPSPSDRDHVEIKNDFIFDMLCKSDIEYGEKIKLLEKEREDIKEKLRDLIHDKSSKSGQYKITKSFRKGSIDYDAIEVIKEIDLDKYRKPGTETWKVTKLTLP